MLDEQQQHSFLLYNFLLLLLLLVFVCIYLSIWVFVHSNTINNRIEMVIYVGILFGFSMHTEYSAWQLWHGMQCVCARACQFQRNLLILLKTFSNNKKKGIIETESLIYFHCSVFRTRCIISWKIPKIQWAKKKRSRFRYSGSVERQNTHTKKYRRKITLQQFMVCRMELKHFFNRM